VADGEDVADGGKAAYCGEEQGEGSGQGGGRDVQAQSRVVEGHGGAGEVLAESHGVEGRRRELSDQKKGEIMFESLTHGLDEIQTEQARKAAEEEAASRRAAHERAAGTDQKTVSGGVEGKNFANKRWRVEERDR
jgi:hypothetical protein